MQVPSSGELAGVWKLPGRADRTGQDRTRTAWCTYLTSFPRETTAWTPTDTANERVVRAWMDVFGGRMDDEEVVCGHGLEDTHDVIAVLIP